MTDVLKKQNCHSCGWAERYRCYWVGCRKRKRINKAETEWELNKLLLLTDDTRTRWHVVLPQTHIYTIYATSILSAFVISSIVLTPFQPELMRFWDVRMTPLEYEKQCEYTFCFFFSVYEAIFICSQSYFDDGYHLLRWRFFSLHSAHHHS